MKPKNIFNFLVLCILLSLIIGLCSTVYNDAQVVQWRVSTSPTWLGDFKYLRPISDHDTVYFTGGDFWPDYYLYAIDLKTGRIKWRFKAGKNKGGTPVIAKQVIYYASNEKIIALNKLPESLFGNPIFHVMKTINTLLIRLQIP